MYDPARRAEELDTTGSARPYVVEYEALVADAGVLECRAHRHLAAVRERSDREWFRCTPGDAITALRDLIGEGGGPIHECCYGIDPAVVKAEAEAARLAEEARAAKVAEAEAARLAEAARAAKVAEAEAARLAEAARAAKVAEAEAARLAEAARAAKVVEAEAARAAAATRDARAQERSRNSSSPEVPTRYRVQPCVYCGHRVSPVEGRCPRCATQRGGIRSVK